MNIYVPKHIQNTLNQQQTKLREKLPKSSIYQSRYLEHTSQKPPD